MRDSLYFLTSIQNRVDDINYRTWGFFLDFDKVKHIAENNVSDLHETIYDFLVIEEFRYDELYPASLWEKGYKWEENKWVNCEKPLDLKHYRGFALG